MKMKHLIIEGFCDGDENQNTYQCNGNLKFGVHCLECPRFSYTFCPNEIAISDEEGIVEAGIGFGGDMEPDEAEKREEYVTIWNEICKEKMNEAYDEFMKALHNLNI
ncbi:MAG: hypothetical protein K2M78_04750 [Lachnospiraceae bacterium]|nr:hypothetical protein [Lachnospiraceae bacterium]